MILILALKHLFWGLGRGLELWLHREHITNNATDDKQAAVKSQPKQEPLD